MATTRHATRRPHESVAAFAQSFDSMHHKYARMIQIAAKLSACLDECLEEYSDLVPPPLRPSLPTDTGLNEKCDTQEQLAEDLLSFVRAMEQRPRRPDAPKEASPMLSNSPASVAMAPAATTIDDGEAHLRRKRYSTPK